MADPNYAAMSATRSRRVKTDKRDARTLAEACKLGAYRPAHRASDESRHQRAQLAVREALVRTRTRYMALVSARGRREGLRVADGGAEAFVARVAALALPGRLRAEVAPLLSLMLHLNAQIAFLDGVLGCLARQDAQVARLCTMPQVGPVTACAFASAVDDPTRFSGPHQVEAYLGLVPRERSRGEKQRKGPITKAGNERVRWLLVQVALSLLWGKNPQTAHLREWAERIAARRGKKTVPLQRRARAARRIPRRRPRGRKGQRSARPRGQHSRQRRGMKARHLVRLTRLHRPRYGAIFVRKESGAPCSVLPSKFPSR